MTLDELFLTRPGERVSAFARMKTLPDRATLAHLTQWVHHVTWVRILGDVWPALQDVPVMKRQYFAAEVQSLDIAEILHYGVERRRVLLACFLYETLVRVQDELVTMFLKRIAAIHTRARVSLESLCEQERATTEQWADALATITHATTAQTADEALGHATRMIIGQLGGATKILEAYEVLSTYHGNNYYPLLWKHFRVHRTAFFHLLRTLDIRSTSQDQTLTEAIDYLKAHETTRKRYIAPPFGLDRTTDQWRRTIIVRRKNRVYYDRRRLEVCLFSLIASEFKSGDLALVQSHEYADLREQLLPWKHCEPLV